MQFIAFTLLTSTIIAMVLFVLYSAVLVKVLTGSKYKLVCAIVVMLMVSDLALIAVCYCNDQIILKKNYEEGLIITHGVLTGLFFLTFNLAHFILAWQYKTLSEDIPKVLEEDYLEVSQNRVLYWSLFAANILLPLLFPVFIIKFNNGIVNGQGVSTAMQTIFSVDTIGIGLLQIISGVILVQSVFAIRDFYQRRGEVESISQRRIITHAVAFGAFLVPQTIYYAAALVHIFFGKYRFVYTIYIAADLLSTFANLISQAVLALIFWDLGTVEERGTEVSDGVPEVSNFDEDAAL